jgi:hypothetical protein
MATVVSGSAELLTSRKFLRSGASKKKRTVAATENTHHAQMPLSLIRHFPTALDSSLPALVRLFPRSSGIISFPGSRRFLLAPS